MGQGLDLPEHDGSVCIPKEYPTTNLRKRKNEKNIIGKEEGGQTPKGTMGTGTAGMGMGNSDGRRRWRKVMMI